MVRDSDDSLIQNSALKSTQIKENPQTWGASWNFL